TENTVKNSTEIDAAGSKSIAFNFGTTYQLTGNNIIEIHGGNITDVATVYQWVNYSGTANASVNSHFSFYGGNIENVTSGPRNSSTAVFDVKGNVNYDFYGGNFINVYTGIYKRGTVNGNIIYNVYGGNFANGIKFSNMYNSGGNSTLGNTAVIVHSKGKDGYSVTSPITLSSDPEKPVAKLNETTKFVAVINNAELDKANFDSGLVADYKLRVYGGSAQPVFENGTLAGFSLCADNNAFVPAVNGVILESGQNGLYTLPEGETSIHFAINANTEYKENDTPEQLAGKLVVHGAQIRKADSALRFVATIGKDILDAMEDFDSDNTVCQKEKITGYGFAVIPENYIAPGVEPCIGMDKVRTVPAVNKYDTSNSNYICYTVCITGISCENASLNYVVRPYFTYEDSTGQTVTIYGKTYATSISAVSEMAIAADDKALK
ncbi:MAG: hypothetical protein IKV97_06290, partial [Clostridia bacterium]|nr:hypothetical protein [Clostridia bacterium]